MITTRSCQCLGHVLRRLWYLAAFFHATLSLWGLFPAAVLAPAQHSQMLHLHQSVHGPQSAGDRRQQTNIVPSWHGDRDSNQNMVCYGTGQQLKYGSQGQGSRRQTGRQTDTYICTCHQCYSRQWIRVQSGRLGLLPLDTCHRPQLSDRTNAAA